MYLSQLVFVYILINFRKLSHIINCDRFCFRFLPFGVLFMIAEHVVEVHHWQTIMQLGKFMAVVISGWVFIRLFTTNKDTKQDGHNISLCTSRIIVKEMKQHKFIQSGSLTWYLSNVLNVHPLLRLIFGSTSSLLLCIDFFFTMQTVLTVPNNSLSSKQNDHSVIYEKAFLKSEDMSKHSMVSSFSSLRASRTFMNIRNGCISPAETSWPQEEHLGNLMTETTQFCKQKRCTVLFLRF